MSTNDPKYIEGGYNEIHTDTIKLLKKGKASSIPFIAFFIFLISLFFIFKNHIGQHLEQYGVFSEVVLLLLTIVYAMGFLFVSCCLQETLNYTYLQKKMKLEDNIDCFFYAFKNYKAIFASIRHETLSIVSIFSVIIFIYIIIAISPAQPSTDPVPPSLSEQLGPVLFKIKLISDGLSNLFLFYSISSRIVPVFNITSAFMYLNMIKFGIDSEQSKVLTLKGIALNESMLGKLNRNAIYFLLIQFIVPFGGFISLFLLLYWLCFFHCAWQKIYNNQDGVTEKVTEKVENNLFIPA